MNLSNKKILGALVVKNSAKRGRVSRHCVFLSNHVKQLF